MVIFQDFQVHPLDSVRNKAVFLLLDRGKGGLGFLLEVTMKKCYQCKEWKETSEFYKNRGTKDGFNCYCKTCVKKNDIKNKEKNGERRKKYYIENREKIAIAQRLGHLKHREKRLKKQKEYFKNNKNKIYMKKKEYMESCDGKLKIKEYRSTDDFKKRNAKSSKKQRKKNPLRTKACNIVNKAIQKGKIKKESCFICDSFSTEAHHPDYSKPLKIIWLCKKCHSELHRKLRSKTTQL